MLSASKDLEPSQNIEQRTSGNQAAQILNVMERERDGSGTTASVGTSNEDWGIVNVSSGHDKSGLNHRTGILILSGQNETTGSAGSLSSDNHIPIQTALSSPMESDTTYLIEDMSEQQSYAENEEHEIASEPSIPSDIPSNLDNISHTSEVSVNFLTRNNNLSYHRTPPFRSPAVPTQDVSFISMPYNDVDEKSQSQGNSEALRTLTDELAVVEAIFRSSKARFLNPYTLLYVALGISCCVALGAFFTLERRAWQASNRRLEERIELLQLELLRKLDSEKELRIQRNSELEELKQEFKEAINKRDAVISKNFGQKQENCGDDLKKEDWSISLGFSPASSTARQKDVHFQNCWIQAEAKLGECAREARDAFQSKFHILGRSLWNVQEHVVSKVNDFGKRVHSAAKEAAERVVVEAENWSNKSSEQSEGSNVDDKSSRTSFSSIATTLVSSVALASVASVVADQASAYIASLGEEKD